MNARLDQYSALSAIPSDDECLQYADIALAARSLPLNVRRFFLILTCSSLASSLYFLIRYGGQLQGASAVLVGAIIASSYVCVRMNKGLMAARIIIWGGWCAASLWGFLVLGIRTPFLYVYPGILMIACWLLPRRESIALIVLTPLMMLAQTYGEDAGWMLATAHRDEWDYLISFAPIAICGALASLTINNRFVVQFRTVSRLGRELETRLVELGAAETKVRKLHHDLHMVAENVPAMIATFDSEGHYRYVNRRYAAMFGETPEGLVGRKADEAMQAALRMPGRSRHEIDAHQGGKRMLEVDVVPEGDSPGSGYYALMRDVTEMVRAEEQLRHMASHDSLTGLPNRLYAQTHLNRSISRAQREGCSVAVLFVDLDDFKGVNDTLGHDHGDQVLREVAHRMTQCLRGSDVIARLGGDEFIIVLEGLTGSGIAHVASRLIEVLHAPIVLERREEVHTAASIGIACYPGDGDNAAMLLRNADTAMYRAKAGGRGRFSFYEASMTVDAVDRLKMLASLREAMRRDEFHLVLQPQVDIHNGQLLGAEALLRWNSAELGAVSPARFIPLAEEAGMIHEIGRWVFRQACREWRRLDDQGLRLPKLAVNIAAVQLERFDLAGMIEAAALESDVPLEVLQIEVTETALAGLDDAHTHLEILCARGLSIAIDDFGTGHSSLSRLKTFPLNTLKIDRSFVKDLGVDQESEAIVRIIIELARLLDIDVVAEGVETPEQAQYLLASGCRVAQGYHFGRPKLADDLLLEWGAAA
ncbi:MAG TPA: EAL domain-containing protein [Rhodocyclaceae bacterium]|nr:EAL domain-containing protein [Rhodocyclaceae bacterium]